MLNKCVNILVVEPAFNEGQVFGNLLLHLFPEQDFEQLDVFYNRVDFIAVEGEGFFKLFENADKIENEAMGLFPSPAASFS